MRHFRYKVVRPKARKNLAVVKLAGFINASTLADFESLLDELLLEQGLDVVLDLDRLSYVNSSGIGAIINYHHAWRSKGDDLVLIRVDESVATVMHQLGLTRLVPILKDEQEAIEYLKRDARGGRAYPSLFDYLRQHRKKGEASRRAQIPVARRRSADPNAPRSVLVVEPSIDPFTDVLERRFNGGRGRFTVVHDCVKALTIFDQVNPDVVILRDRVEGADDFVSKIKIERGKSLVSVIKVYGSGSDPMRGTDFKIWENDYFIEPFEVMELFRLAEQELKRVPRSRETYLHQTHFQFATSEENVEKAGQLGRNLIHQSTLPEEEAQALTAAFKEAVDNARRHAHRSSPRRKVDVTFLLDPNRLTITITDEGDGFDYRGFLQELQNEEAYVRARKAKSEGRKGGLGILLMHKCTDRLEFLGRGNRIRLIKRLPADGAGRTGASPPETKRASASGRG